MAEVDQDVALDGMEVDELVDEVGVGEIPEFPILTDAEITVMTILLLKAALTERNIPFQNHGRSKLYYVDMLKICEAERRLGAQDPAVREAARLALAQADEIANRLLAERVLIEAENVERLRRDQVARDAAALLRAPGGAHHHIGDRFSFGVGK